MAKSRRSPRNLPCSSYLDLVVTDLIVSKSEHTPHPRTFTSVAKNTANRKHWRRRAQGQSSLWMQLQTYRRVGELLRTNWTLRHLWLGRPSMHSMAFRSLIRSPSSLRPLLLQPIPLRALYHSYDHVDAPPYRNPEATILSSALTHVPTHGFTQETLALGANDAGYLDISTNLFPKGAFDLVLYYLVTQRLSLKDRIQFPTDEKQSGGTGRRVRSLILERLRANAHADVVGRWHEALGLMSLPENVPSSLRELARLSDEIWFLAGDTAVDASWYSKRATLAAVYAAAETFQTTDQSTDFKDTAEFVDRRLEEVRTVGTAVGGAVEWLGFQGGALVNLLRSKGMRI